MHNELKEYADGEVESGSEEGIRGDNGQAEGEVTRQTEQGTKEAKRGAQTMH